MRTFTHTRTHARSHNHTRARTLTRTLTGKHISSRVEPLVRGSVVGHSLYFCFFFRLVCEYVPEVARNLVPRPQSRALMVRQYSVAVGPAPPRSL